MNEIDEFYPLCVDGDIPLMDDAQLLRFIREKCGDDVAACVTARFKNQMPESMEEDVSMIANGLHEAADALENAEIGVKSLFDQIRKAGGGS